MIDLIIFDCDGVLIDSEPLAIKVGTQVLNEVGFPVTEEDILAYVGITGPAMYADLQEKHQKTIPDDFRERWTSRMKTTFETELRAIDGVHEVVENLGMPFCVASNSRPDYLATAFRIVNLTDQFGKNVFSAEMVEKGKPAPDLFLYAADQMGVAPANCLVIEDSVNGINAAVAAEMPVLGFTGGGHCKPGDEEKLMALGADKVFSTMTEISRHLSRSNR